MASSTGKQLLTPTTRTQTNHINIHELTHKNDGKGSYYSESVILERIKSLLPENLPAQASPQIRTSWQADNSKTILVKPQESLRRKKRLQKNASSVAVKSRFIQPSVKESSIVPSQRIATFPTTTATTESSLAQLLFGVTTEKPKLTTQYSFEPSTSTSTSTSVSMSYTTVLDSSKITTVLNSDHFLLSRRNGNVTKSSKNTPRNVKFSGDTKKILAI